MSISQLCIERPVMTMMMVASIVVFGVISFLALPVNDLPSTDYPVITVNVGYPGANPETMAANIATPLERQFMQISGLELVTSQSTQGSTKLTLQFSLSKSIDAAATDVQAAITRATGNLPADLPSPPTFTKTNPNDQPIVYMALVSNTQTEGQLYDYANTQIGQRISIMNGVSQVSVYGQKSATLIKVDPSKLAIRGLTLNDFVTAVQSGTTYQGAGQFDGSTRTFLLNPMGQLENAHQYDDLIISQKNGSILRVRDVAKTYNSVQDERFAFNIWLRGYDTPSAAVVLAVNKSAGANAVDVAASIRTLLKQLQVETPASMQLHLLYDRSKTIIGSVNDVEETLLIAFGLVVLVIYIFLGRLTDTIIPAVALPLSLMLTAIPMYALGYSLDNLSLLALTLAIGFLVDDAIVFLENTVRRMEAGEDAMTASIKGAEEIMFTIVSMTLSLAAVFIPLVFMPGLVGRIFREFSVTIVLSILASGMVSITVTPLMCSRMLHDRHGAKKTWLEGHFDVVLKKVIKSYGDSLYFFLHHRWVSAVTWVICMVGTCYLYVLVPKTFLPTGDSGFIMGVFIAPEGSSPDQMKAFQKQIDAVLHKNEYVQQTITMSGLSGFLPSSFGLVLAFLDDAATHKRPSIEVINAQLSGALMSVPGIFPSIRPQPTLEISTGATSNNQGKYAYTISGIDPQEVYGTAQKMMAKMRALPELSSVSSDMQLNTPQLKIHILRDQASTYGVTAQMIEATLRNAYSQNYVYLVKKTSDQYQVIVETDDRFRSRPQDLALLYVNSSNGAGPVPLSAVAKWEETLGPQAVNHVNQFVSASVFFDLKPGAAIGTVTNKVEALGKEVVPLGVLANLQGEADLFTQMVNGMVSMLFFAIFVMYVILGILYENYLHPVTVLSALPVASIGGLLTLLVFNQELSLYGFIGMFMLMGIVKKNGIMMIDFALQRMDEGLDRNAAVHEACLERFRPIMMTSLAALMGAVPLALGWGNDGASRQPLGLIIVGGLIFSQLITLYVTPALFLYMEQVQEGVFDKYSFLKSSRHRKHNPVANMDEAKPVA